MLLSLQWVNTIAFEVALHSLLKTNKQTNTVPWSYIWSPYTSFYTSGPYIKGGNCTPNQKLACFVIYLKIINTFLKHDIFTKLSRELKNAIEILIGSAVF